MFLKIISINFLLAYLIIITNSQDNTSETSLEDFDDKEIEDELRRRWLGGPWSPDEASTILNSAIDVLFNKNQPNRPRKFQAEAKHIIELLTADPESQVEDDTPRIATNDMDYYDDQVMIGSGHHVSSKTMRTILDMYEGTNGQKKRGTDSIEKLYSWFRL